MNLCEKSGVSFNVYGRFYSPRKTIIFAEVKKDFFGRQMFHAKSDNEAKLMKGKNCDPTSCSSLSHPSSREIHPITRRTLSFRRGPGFGRHEGLSL
jgi:hypothetical protein